MCCLVSHHEYSETGGVKQTPVLMQAEANSQHDEVDEGQMSVMCCPVVIGAVTL